METIVVYVGRRCLIGVMFDMVRRAGARRVQGTGSVA